MSKDDGRYVESEAVAEVNRKMEQWLKEQSEKPKRLVGYLISSKMLEGLLEGKITTDIPKGARIYKIQLWRPEDADKMLNVWFEHESFSEVPWGNVIEIRWTTCTEIK